MSPRPLKRLLLKGFLILILSLVLWVYVLQPPYSRLLVSVSQKVHSWIEKKEKTLIQLQGDMIVFVPQGLATQEQKRIPAGKRDVRELDYNSVILITLILFSPGLRGGKRMLVLVAGFALLFLTHLLNILVQVKFFYALQLGGYSQIPYGPWERNIYAFLKQFFELIGRFAFPFAIWMLFTYRETTGYLTGTEPEKNPRKKRKK
jgi:hypothetical protein